MDEADRPVPGDWATKEGGADCEGTTRNAARLVEYALLALLIVVASIVAVSLTGGKASKKFCPANSVIDGCGDGIPGCFGCP